MNIPIRRNKPFRWCCLLALLRSILARFDIVVPDKKFEIIVFIYTLPLFAYKSTKFYSIKRNQSIKSTSLTKFIIIQSI